MTDTGPRWKRRHARLLSIVESGALSAAAAVAAASYRVVPRAAVAEARRLGAPLMLVGSMSYTTPWVLAVLRTDTAALAHDALANLGDAQVASILAVDSLSGIVGVTELTARWGADVQPRR